MAAEIIKLEDKAVTGLSNDPEIWVSLGRGRYDKSWKGRKMKWSQLLARLAKPTVTQETQAEFFRMSKDQQDKIKDIGGFVGGTLTSGRRLKQNAGLRYLLTYDMDFAPKDFVDDLKLTADYAWCVYSTHKYTDENPRLRLIIPIKRELEPDEYEAVMRMLASEIGLAYMDKTTFEPTRLMYWPSASRDGAYVFDYADGPSLDPDEILARYPGDWHDVSLWPLCPDEARVGRQHSSKIEDPTTKQGLVGVFCRTYTVPEAIEAFLPEVYTATSDENRYTYAAGSTSGGMIIYDDGLACYSWHSTDPAGQRDLNAYDLVRIHKFGADDPVNVDELPMGKRPSVKAMDRLIETDPRCKRTLLQEIISGAREDFEEDPNADPDAWTEDLEVNKAGITSTYKNAWLILGNDPKLRGLKLNDLTGDIDCTADMPWPRPQGGHITDSDSDQMYKYVVLNYGVEFSDQKFQKAMQTVASDHRYDPLMEFVQHLPEWDGVPRVDTLLLDYFECIDEPYVRAVTRKTMCGAIARALHHGCKFDYMLVIGGPGGIGKSTFFRRLGGEFFSDSLQLTDVRDKTAVEQVRGRWIIEAPELAGRAKYDVEQFKAFLTKESDRFRPAYGRAEVELKRTSIIVGTTNSVNGYLTDLTGNRRFWPVDLTGRGRLNAVEMTEETRLQILAEAKHLYVDLGETLYLPPELEAVAEEKQRAHIETSDREGDVRDYLDADLPANWYDMAPSARHAFFAYGDDDGEKDPAEGTFKREFVTAKEICQECFNGQWPRTNAETRELTAIMLKLGWDNRGPKRRVPKYFKSPTRVYTRRV